MPQPGILAQLFPSLLNNLRAGASAGGGQDGRGPLQPESGNEDSSGRVRSRLQNSNNYAVNLEKLLDDAVAWAYDERACLEDYAEYAIWA